MPSVLLERTDIPFLLGGSAKIAVDTGALPLDRSLPEGTEDMLRLDLGLGRDRKLRLGRENTVQVGASSDARVALTATFSSSDGPPAKFLAENGLGEFFRDGANEDKVVLGLDVGGSASASASAPFTYSSLKATAEVDAGADGGYTYLKALDKALPVQDLLRAFFRSARLPEQLPEEGGPAPAPGEGIALRYGGYLHVSADVSAGYELAGTRFTSLGEMALSERYALSIIGKVGLSAAIAGRFSILVTASEEPGWARVQVHRCRSKDLKVAADVNVGFKSQLGGLPGSADEFLGAVLGVNAKSFLNVFAKAHELSDFKTFEESIDGLAKMFVGEFIGKGFDKLESSAEFSRFISRVNRIVTSYEEVGDRAVTLFDRYYEELDVLTGFLERVRGANSTEILEGEQDPVLWNVLSQLTDGDPLGFLLGQVVVGGRRTGSLAELKKRTEAVLDLIQDDAHEEIRSVVVLAKARFGIEMFFRELAKLDTVDELEAVANERVGQFVTRLVGRTLHSKPSIREAFERVRAVLGRIDSFKETVFLKFREAANASYRASLHAEYSRAREGDSLVDVLLNLADLRGVEFLRQAARGDFEEVLSSGNRDVVRLGEGILTHRTRRENTFRVNVVGWHLNYNYEGFDRVITEAEQRFVPSGRGITILSTTTLEIGRLRKRQDEEMHVNFLLRALGESRRVVRSDAKSLSYLIETLSSLTARYELSFTDEDTREEELRNYLAFARSLGLDREGASFAALEPVLPRTTSGSFGPVRAAYDVRFGAAAIDALLSVTELTLDGEARIRAGLRRVVLGSYIKRRGLQDIALAYATPGMYERYRDHPGEFRLSSGFNARTVTVAVDMPGLNVPSRVLLSPNEYWVLGTLYSIEDSMIRAVKDLCLVLGAKKAIEPVAFAAKLERFGDALRKFDKFDRENGKDAVGTTTIFVVFDMLVRMAAGGGERAAASTLTLTSRANGREVQKVFLSDCAAGDQRVASRGWEPVGRMESRQSMGGAGRQTRARAARRDGHKETQPRLASPRSRRVGAR